MAPVDGFWGQVTSTIDWCEENYVVSWYIAEFWNTLSNCLMIFAPLWMLHISRKEKHEFHLACSFFAVTVVGIGSWLFHMTLRYSMQLMDEIPMIWGSIFLIYASYTADNKPNEECKPLLIILTVYSAVVTLVYVIVNDPVFHEFAYGIMVFAIVILGARILIKFECNKFLFLFAFVTYGLGFFLWNIDNHYCPHLRSIRGHTFGQYVGPVFQCHAWWHIFAGMGTYFSLLFQTHTRYLYLKKDPQIKFLCFVWPYVSIKKSMK